MFGKIEEGVQEVRLHNHRLARKIPRIVNEIKLLLRNNHRILKKKIFLFKKKKLKNKNFY
jgi:hypothetical protein